MHRYPESITGSKRAISADLAQIASSDISPCETIALMLTPLIPPIESKQRYHRLTLPQDLKIFHLKHIQPIHHHHSLDEIAFQINMPALTPQISNRPIPISI